MWNRAIMALAGVWLSMSALAAAPAIYVKHTDMALDAAYQRVYAALEEHRFWVVFEADLAQRMARFKDRWGDDYNRSGLSGARSMVFCNIWWTNAIAGADPDMLSLCPLHLSLYAREGQTSVVMLRPSVVAKGSGAEKQARELERELIGVIESALGKGQ